VNLGFAIATGCGKRIPLHVQNAPGPTLGTRATERIGGSAATSRFSLDSASLRDALHRLAANHRWTWAHSTRQLLASLPGADPQTHPATVVARLDNGQLDALLADDEVVGRVRHELAVLDDLLAGAAEPRIAYLSPEFGFTALIPQYAGGLGVLAGDHMKAASDMGLALAGVGLLYRDGVFRQVIVDGVQSETYHRVDPDGVGAEDTGLVVEVPFPGRDVSAKVWRLDVGGVSILLLDTDIEANSKGDREITDSLYHGFTTHRVDQEMILGVGGGRALQAMDWPIGAHHLNEGHAGFVVLELIDRVIEGGDIGAAVDLIRPGLIFTTHTPVPAGIDRFSTETISPYLEIWAERWGASFDDVWQLGVDPDDPAKFNMAAMCLRVAGAANGVSELHGEVSRGLFAGVGLGDRIGSVTNGVHARTWTAPHLQTVFDDLLGEGWAAGGPESWERVVEIDKGTLEGARRRSSRLLAEMVRARAGRDIDPDALIIGFARRFAPYKRATLFMRHRERLDHLLDDDDHPVHFLFAGKAHPADDLGKHLVAEVVGFAESPESMGKVTFIPDYDMDIAAALVQGCDIWLNNPIRPREASGTSGEKAALNGGLNCSILDGWWAEMFDGENGWAIPISQNEDLDARDDEEASAMLDLLVSIRDEYHSARPVFNGRVRHAWRTLGPRVSAMRMLREYEERFYRPALEQAGFPVNR